MFWQIQMQILCSLKFAHLWTNFHQKLNSNVIEKEGIELSQFIWWFVISQLLLSSSSPNNSNTFIILLIIISYMTLSPRPPPLSFLAFLQSCSLKHHEQNISTPITRKCTPMNSRELRNTRSVTKVFEVVCLFACVSFSMCRILFRF